MTEPQKQAWYLLVFFICMAVYSVLLIVGIEWLSATVGLICQGIVGFLIVRYLVARKNRGKPPIKEDERDKMILSRVPRFQNTITLMVLCVWFMIFSFRYDYAYDIVSVKSVNLILMSIVLANIVAYPVGILIAYWWENRHGKGSNLPS